jgi:hypothetical protein
MALMVNLIEDESVSLSQMVIDMILNVSGIATQCSVHTYTTRLLIHICFISLKYILDC